MFNYGMKIRVLLLPLLRRNERTYSTKMLLRLDGAFAKGLGKLLLEGIFLL